MKSNALFAMLYRDGKLFLSALWRILAVGILFAAVSAGLALSLFSGLREKAEAPLAVALVDEDGSLISRLGINYVSSQKNIAAILSVDSVVLSDAEMGVTDGKYVGAVILPKDYLNAILAGDYVRGRVLLSDGSSVNTELLSRMTRTGEELIRMGQYGVFASASVVAKTPQTRPLYDSFLVRINDSLIYEATTATDRYIQNEELPYSTSLALLPHTVLIALLTTLSLFTLLFYGVFTADLTPKRASRLLASGVTPPVFLLPKVSLAFVFRALFAAALLIPACMLLDIAIAPQALPLFLCALLLICLWETLFSVVLAGNRFGIALFSLSLLVELFLVGGILPLSYLSDGIRALGGILPLGLAYNAASSLFGGQASSLSLLWLIVWTLPMLFAATWRIRHTATEGRLAK